MGHRVSINRSTVVASCRWLSAGGGGGGGICVRGAFFMCCVEVIEAIDEGVGSALATVPHLLPGGVIPLRKVSISHRSHRSLMTLPRFRLHPFSPRGSHSSSTLLFTHCEVIHFTVPAALSQIPPARDPRSKEVWEPVSKMKKTLRAAMYI